MEFLAGCARVSDRNIVDGRKVGRQRRYDARRRRERANGAFRLLRSSLSSKSKGIVCCCCFFLSLSLSFSHQISWQQQQQQTVIQLQSVQSNLLYVEGLYVSLMNAFPSGNTCTESRDGDVSTVENAVETLSKIK